jgi:CPA2 family monovalent cation:H+ antiporter-2
MDLWTILSDIVILLAASLLLGGIMSKIGQSPLVGYLLAGMLLGGPGSVGAVRSEHEIEAIAELGVALLLFSLGLEFSLERLKQLGPKPLMGGALQVIVTIVLGAAVAMAFGLSITESVAVGLMISLSSTAIVLRILMDRAELEMPHGRNSLAVLLIQDIAVVPLALVMTLLTGGGGPSEVLLNVGKVSMMAGALVAGLFILIKIAVPALGTLTLLRNRELTVIFAIVTGLGSAWAAHEAGLSPALGAFLAGMFLGSSPFATQIRADVSSIRVVLLTLFFGAAGMVADPIWIITNGHIVAAVTIAITFGKLAIIWTIFRLLGQTVRVAAATGICLAQIGEFAFVLGSIGLGAGVISQDLYGLIVSVAIVSFFLSAVLVPKAPRFGNKIAALFGQTLDPDNDPLSEDLSPEIVFIGFGPAGQIAAKPFVDKEVRVLVIDLNKEGVRRAQLLGFQGHVGDATQSEVLEHAHVSRAKSVVITIPHNGSAMTILEHVHQMAPSAHVVVRSRHQIFTNEFQSAGAEVVVGDEEQVGEGMAQHLQTYCFNHDAQTMPRP